MAQKEREIINRRLSSLAPDTRLFRINSGTGWVGDMVRKGDFIIIKNPRPLHAAPIGWPDLCGWESVEITPDMVGRHVAVFVGEEIKASGKLRPEQAAFRDLILRMGGVWRLVTS